MVGIKEFIKQKKMLFPKKVYPHIHEYINLGESKTEEGRSYLEKYQNEIDSEYSTILDLVQTRFLMGDNKKIHDS